MFIYSVVKTQRNHVKKFRKKLLNVVFLFPWVLFGCYGLKNSRFDEKPAPNPERVFAVFGRRVSNLDTAILERCAAETRHARFAVCFLAARRSPTPSLARALASSNVCA